MKQIAMGISFVVLNSVTFVIGTVNATGVPMFF